MKKTGILLVLISLFSAGHALPAYAQETDMTIKVNGSLLRTDVSPIVENGTTLVQFRPLFEKLGLKVDWDESSRTVSGTREGLKIELQIDNPMAKVNDVTKKLDTPPIIRDGSTMVPLRFMSEYTGNQVKWNEADRTISVNGPEFVKSIRHFGNENIKEMENMDSVVEIDLFEKDGTFYMIWCEADANEKKFIFRLSSANVDKWNVQEKKILEIPFYKESDNKQPPIMIMSDMIFYEDANGLKRATYNEKGELLSNETVVQLPGISEIGFIRKVYSASGKGIMWGPADALNIYMTDAFDKPIPVNMPLPDYYLGINKPFPFIMDQSHTHLIFGTTIDKNELTRLDIRTGQFDKETGSSSRKNYPAVPDDSFGYGTQLLYGNGILYFFYTTTESTNMVRLDPESLQVTGDYRYLFGPLALATIAGNELHVWNLPERSGELSLTVFRLPGENDRER